MKWSNIRLSKQQEEKPLVKKNLEAATTKYSSELHLLIGCLRRLGKSIYRRLERDPIPVVDGALEKPPAE